MTWNQCMRKRGNVPTVTMMTHQDLQNLHKMGRWIVKQIEAAVVLPHRLRENSISLAILRAESDIFLSFMLHEN